MDVRREESLLGLDDPNPVGIRNAGSRSDFLLICDHAGNAVPEVLDGLGLGSADLRRHIAYDVGILEVAQQLADILDAPLVYQRYSRLVVECNRRLSSPASMAVVSDGTSVPANRGLGSAARARRVSAIFAPYHDEITRRLDERLRSETPTTLISMHSFTPSLLSPPLDRPWHVGVCHGRTDRFTMAVLEALSVEPDILVGRNEPYGVDMENDYSIPTYGEGRGLPYAEFEVRQDLIRDAAGQSEWALRLARVLAVAKRAFGHG